jgi:hypothetical protein
MLNEPPSIQKSPKSALINLICFWVQFFTFQTKSSESVIFFLPNKLEKFRISSLNLTSFFFYLYIYLKISNFFYHKNWKRKEKRIQFYISNQKCFSKRKSHPKLHKMLLFVWFIFGRAIIVYLRQFCSCSHVQLSVHT